MGLLERGQLPGRHRRAPAHPPDPNVAKATGRKRVIRDLRETVQYVRQAPGILTCLAVVAGLSFADSPLFQFVVVFSDEVFKVDTWVGVPSVALGMGPSWPRRSWRLGRGGAPPEARRRGDGVERDLVDALRLSPNAWFGFSSSWAPARGTSPSPPASTPPSNCRWRRPNGGRLGLLPPRRDPRSPHRCPVSGVPGQRHRSAGAFTFAGAAFLSLLALLRSRGSLRHLDAESALVPAS